MPSITLTNVSTSSIFFRDLYATLDPGEQITISRSTSEMTEMTSVQEAIASGMVTSTVAFDSTETGSGWDPTYASNDVLRVSTLAALSTVDVTNRSEAFVASNRAEFYRDATSTLTVDGNTVLATSTGVGRWIRREVGHPVYQSQATWFLDPASGNDENTGLSSGTAIKTVRELRFRLGGVYYQNTTVNILSSIVDADPLMLVLRSVRTTSAQLQPVITFKGQRISMGTGTVTGAVARNMATNTHQSLSDTSVADWTPHIGRHIRMTSGASNGNICGILRDTGSNTAMTGILWSTTSFVVGATPSPGDTYQIDDYTDIRVPGVVVVNGSTAGALVVFENCRLENHSAFGRQVNVTFNACRLYGTTSSSFRFGKFGSFFLNGCSVYDPSMTFGFQEENSILSMYGTTVKGMTLFTKLSIATSTSSDWRDCTFDAVSINIGRGAKLLKNCGFFNFGAAGTGNVISVEDGGFLVLWEGLYGSNPSCFASMNIRTGCRVGVDSAITPTLTGGTQLLIDGVTSHIPPLVAGAAVPAASALSTWAHWTAAPFSRAVITRNGTTVNNWL